MTNPAGRLRNIKIDKVRVQILSIEHETRVLITWTLAPTTQNLSSLRFYIDRSEGADVWLQLNTTGILANTLYEFVDYTANLFDLHKVYEYRVRAIEFSANGAALQTFTSAPAQSEGELDLVGIYVVDEHLFAYKYVYGTPALIFKRRFDGQTCPDCWDTVLKRITSSSCRTCFGTGKLEGYYPPIAGWMHFQPNQNAAQIGMQGNVQPNKSAAEFTNYPEIRIGDIILEARDFFFWKVSALAHPEKNQVRMLQQLSLSAVNRTDIEYKLEVPHDVVKKLVDELEERKSQPEF